MNNPDTSEQVIKDSTNLLENASNKKIEPKIIIYFLIITFVLIIIVLSYNIFFKSNNKNTNLLLTQHDTQEIIKKVSSKIELPTEDPTIIPVTDTQSIKNIGFFTNAQIGDVVIIYSNNQKAILYRPSEDKIIEVGKVLQEEINSDKSATQTPTDSITPTFSETSSDVFSPSYSPTPSLSPSPTSSF